MDFLIYLLVIYYLIVGLPALFFPKKTSKIIGNFVANADIMRLSGIFLLIFSYLFLSNYRKLDGTWNMIISIIGWSSLIKSITIIRFPESLNKKFDFFRSSNGGMMFIGIFTVIVSIFLLRVAYAKF